ncbi:unnamed protein product [Prorocentrum cordatum]|uniref:Uncharacterized protein n=1 Tax=Prorocentrum cordatum TaxID=2364126 RepID=A0ABN9VYX8_9DINO|nr:unnamed protein product [Polarella glacialis]
MSGSARSRALSDTMHCRSAIIVTPMIAAVRCQPNVCTGMRHSSEGGPDLPFPWLRNPIPLGVGELRLGHELCGVHLGIVEVLVELGPLVLELLDLGDSLLVLALELILLLLSLQRGDALRLRRLGVLGLDGVDAARRLLPSSKLLALGLEVAEGVELGLRLGGGELVDLLAQGCELTVLALLLRDLSGGPFLPGPHSTGLLVAARLWAALVGILVGLPRGVLDLGLAAPPAVAAPESAGPVGVVPAGAHPCPNP